MLSHIVYRSPDITSYSSVHDFPVEIISLGFYIDGIFFISSLKNHVTSFNLYTLLDKYLLVQDSQIRVRTIEIVETFEKIDGSCSSSSKLVLSSFALFLNTRKYSGHSSIL